MIFSTKNREKFIREDVSSELYSYIAKVISEHDSIALKIGGISDHIHILGVLSKKYPACKLIEEIKKRSSKWIKSKGMFLSKFSWQSGYGIFSISESQVKDVIGYIEQQREHHKKMSFKEEFRKVLAKYNITYNEKYVWD